jgi:hypothetical protein
MNGAAPDANWRRSGRLFFSEEKKQKTFDFRAPPVSGHGRDLATSADIKVFWFFSSEKNALSPNALKELADILDKP